mgnify:CR=1 FL=1
MWTSNHPIRQWRGRRVWLIGASDGIGLALGRELLKQGASLVVSARRAEALSQEFPEPSVTKCPLDVTDPRSLQQTIRHLQQIEQLPDVVIWLVGQYEPSPLLELQPERAKAVLQVNLLSAYDALAAVLPIWQEALGQHRWPFRPHWVFFSSVAGYRGLPMAADYGASKAGLTYLAQVAHLELQPRGIDVSVVCPGFVQTRLTQKNQFEMPGLLSPDQAAQATLRGLASGAFEIHYPFRLSGFLKLLGLLPIGLYLRLVRRLTRA